MPGLTALGRRWSVGSDDLVIPSSIFLVLHIVWIIILICIVAVPHDTQLCPSQLFVSILGFLILLGATITIEGVVVCISLRGTILYVRPRQHMTTVLYIHGAIFVCSLVWSMLSIRWLVASYNQCSVQFIKQTVLGLIIFHFVTLLSLLILIWCVWDGAGRSFVKLKKTERERNMKRTASRVERNQQRVLKTQAQYEQNWDKRLRFWFCCTSTGEAQESAFSDIALLFSEFFRDLDVVPTDILAGLMLLREEQKQRRRAIENSPQNSVIKFLSGVAVTPETKFLDFQDPKEVEMFEELHYYFKFAAAAYGWTGYAMVHGATGCCGLAKDCRCCCFKDRRQYHLDASDPEADNCCMCNFVALKKMSGLNDSDIIYTTFHVSVWETPFYVALDHVRRRVVVSIRGTLSVPDIVTDLSADTSPIQTEDGSQTYFGHKGMVETANYVRRRLIDDMLLQQAFTADEDRGTRQYDLVLVGHSLGAGTAAILGIMLRPEYPALKVYAYSPPGGLLCKESCEYSEEFVTSLIVGKDVVSRMGLSQMEFLRADLLNCIKMCRDPKWKVIFGELMCCCEIHSRNLAPMEEVDAPSPSPWRLNKAFHPTNHALVLSTHSPLFPPGKILQIVRNNPKREGLSRKECAYYAIWRGMEDFNEVLISPVIINDHLPGGVMKALDKCMEYGKRHGLPKRWSQVGKMPMDRRKQSQVSVRSASRSSSSHSSWLQMKPVKSSSKKDVTTTVHFQDSPSKSSSSKPEFNNNVQSGKETKPEEEMPFLPESPPGVSAESGGMTRTTKDLGEGQSLLPTFSNNNTHPVTGHEKLAPLASVETLTDVESARSSISSTSFSSVLNRFQNPQGARDEGYCYYVENESQSTINNNMDDSEDESSENPSPNRNTLTTMATIEAVPNLNKSQLTDNGLSSTSHFGPWNLFRGASSHLFDHDGNVKGRTSSDDRYTLTYGSHDLGATTGSEGDKSSPSVSQAHSSDGVTLPSLQPPDVQVGQCYTQYLPLPDSNLDTDEEDNTLLNLIRPQISFNEETSQNLLTECDSNMNSALCGSGQPNDAILNRDSSVETVTPSGTPTRSQNSLIHLGFKRVSASETNC